MKEGETVALSCDTEDAVIWYTTDGSCPCDENGTRVKYTEPIVITAPVTIRAYAVKDEAASRVVSFTYGIIETVGIGMPSVEKQPEEWYTVGGVKLNGKPVTKGLYISNGHKRVVK